jgi:undecaprenyl-diphosphatase
LPDGCGGQFGFASSHAANTMSLTVFFFLLPVFSRSKSIALALLVWAIITGWSRIYLGAHFAGDIVAGYAIGAFWAAILHFFARKISWFGLDGKNLIQTGK